MAIDSETQTESGVVRNLEGSVALVTGASRGIGAAIATRLAQAGASVAAVARDKDALDDVRASFDAPSLSIAADLSDAGDQDRVVEECVAGLGGLNILVNNAGMAPTMRKIQDAQPEDWDVTFAVNVRAPWRLATLAYPHLRASQGNVINLASTSAVHHDVGLGVYGISKASVLMLNKVLAKEWARDKIRVNCIIPGVFRTDLAAGAIQWMIDHDRVPPLGFFAEVEDMAGLVHYVASPEARYMTGAELLIDGGELL